MGTGEGGDHEAVPCGQEFLVAVRVMAFFAGFEEGFSGGVEALRGGFRFEFELGGGFGIAVAADEGVGAGEFAVRIAAGRGVAICLDAIGVVEEWGVLAE